MSMALALATKGMIYNQCNPCAVQEVTVQEDRGGGGDWIDLPKPQRVYYKDLTIKKRKPIIKMRLENESNTR